MRKIKEILAATVFVLVCSIVGNAQGSTDYRFLEVVDYANKPVAGAEIDLQGACSTGKRMTDEKGALEQFPIGGGDCGELRDFTVSKPGYYSFRDLGLFSAPYNDVYRNQFIYDNFRNREKYRIELLKIPQNKTERKAVGSEEAKRELFWAVRDRDIAAVRKLLKAGVGPNLNTNDLRGVIAPKNLPAAVYAAATGDIETVKEFLKTGVSLRKKDSPARGILLYYLGANPRRFYDYLDAGTENEKAEMNRYLDGVDFLINAGTDLSAATGDGRTALMIAASNGDVKTVGTLLTKNLPVNQRDSAGRTALTHATNFSSASTVNKIEIAEKLLAAGANPNVLAFDNGDGGSDTYCQSPLINAVAHRNPALVKLLLDNGADLNLACKNGKTAFRVSIQNRWDKSQIDYEVRNLLLGAGVKLDTVDSYGDTTLMFAVSASDAETVEQLLKTGVSVNAQNKSGETALIKASQRTAIEIVELLLKYDADVNAVADEGSGVIDGKTVAHCKTALMAVARSADSNSEALQVIQTLAAHGANVDFACGDGNTALTNAISNAQVTGVKKLIEVGADASKALQYAKDQKQLYEWRRDKMEEIIKILEATGAK